MFNSNKKIKNQNNTKLIALLAIIFVAILGFGSFKFFANHQNQYQATSPTASQEVPKIDLNPPTEEDLDNVDSAKSDIVQQQAENNNPPATQPDGRKSVVPIISYAAQYGPQIEIGAYVDGILEQAATCTASISKGDQLLKKSVAAVTNVNSMDCPAIVFERSEFTSAGDWQVVIEYSSANMFGRSQPKKVEVI